MYRVSMNKVITSRLHLGWVICLTFSTPVNNLYTPFYWFLAPCIYYNIIYVAVRRWWRHKDNGVANSLASPGPAFSLHFLLWRHCVIMRRECSTKGTYSRCLQGRAWILYEVCKAHCFLSFYLIYYSGLSELVVQNECVSNVIAII